MWKIVLRLKLCKTNSRSFIQESIDIAIEWTTNNDMIINFEKSNSRDGNFRSQVPNITIANNIVEQVE